MPIDSGGNITRPPSPIPVSGQTADAPQVNVPIDDIYASMNQLAFLDGRKALRGNIPMNGHRAVGAGDAVADQDYVTLAQLQSLITGLGVPSGMIEVYTISSSVAPSGWVFANGQSLARATFPALWAAVQAGNNLAATQADKTHGQYGPGDGTTTFTVPNLTADGGYFIRPISSGRGIGTTQADMVGPHPHTATFAGTPVPPHNHNYDYAGAGTDGNFINRTSRARTNSGFENSTTGAGMGEGAAGGHTPSGSVTVNPSSGTETRPKNIAYPVIIKA